MAPKSACRSSRRSGSAQPIPFANSSRAQRALKAMSAPRRAVPAANTPRRQHLLYILRNAVAFADPVQWAYRRTSARSVPTPPEGPSGSQPAPSWHPRRETPSHQQSTRQLATPRQRRAPPPRATPSPRDRLFAFGICMLERPVTHHNASNINDLARSTHAPMLYSNRHVQASPSRRPQTAH